MVMWWVIFREIVPHVLDFWFPINKKVFLFYPVLHSIKSHVHCRGPFLSNYIGYNSFRRGVVCFYLGWWLGKIEFMECNCQRYRCFPIVEQSSNFFFGRGHHHMLEDYAFHVDWYICWWREVWRFFRVSC